MNFKRLRTITALTILSISLVSCKKDEEETTYMSFDGTPSFSIPAFIHVGDVYTLKHDEVTRDESDESTDNYGIAWKISELSICDTVRYEGGDSSINTDFVFEVPDTLTTVTIYCSAFAEGYSSSSESHSCVIVKSSGEGKSLQGVDPSEGCKSFVDVRDNKSYWYATIDGIDWMVQNLAYNKLGKAYYGCAAMEDIFGIYYTWNEASKACPDGWRLPSNSDFLKLSNHFSSDKASDAYSHFNHGAGSLMGDAYFNGTKFWEYWPDVTISNKSSLSLIPTGYAVVTNGNYSFANTAYYCTLWTGDELNEEQAYYRAIYEKYDSILIGSGSKDGFATCVRCVRSR